MRDLAALAGFTVLALAVGAGGGLATASSVGTWYPALAKPPFNQPNWVFGPVSTTLYLLLGKPSDAENCRQNALHALDGLKEEDLVTGVESITVGALRRALTDSGKRNTP